MATEDPDFVVFEKGSPVWQYFLRGTGKRKGYAQCRAVKDNGELCQTILSMGSHSSTGSMNNHIRLVHKINLRKDGPPEVENRNFELQKSLLTEIAKRPNMWNPEHPESHAEKRAVRQEIANILDITEERVAAQWKKLKAQYRKYSAKDPISASEWPLMEYASFLDELPQQHQTWTQVSDSDTNSSFQESANTIPQKRPRKPVTDTTHRLRRVKRERVSDQFENFDSDEYFSDRNQMFVEVDPPTQQNGYSVQGSQLLGGYPGALSTEVYVLARSLRGKDQHKYCQQLSDFARTLMNTEFGHCDRVYEE